MRGRSLRHYNRPTILVVDEVGYLGYDGRGTDLVFQLVSRRYEHRSLLITTNLFLKRRDTVFPNASCAVALIDRLTHHAELLLLEGHSFRRREAELSQQERNRKPPRRGRTENYQRPHLVQETGRYPFRKPHFYKSDNKQIDRETLRARYRWRKRRYAPPASRVASASSASGGAMGVGIAG